MKLKVLSFALLFGTVCVANAGDFQFACTDDSSSASAPAGTPPVIVIAGTSTQKIGHYQLSASAQINGGETLSLTDPNQVGNAYGGTFTDSAQSNSVTLYFDVSYANGALQFNNDGFSLSHLVLPADGKINGVATIDRLNGEVNPAGLANINVSCMGTIAKSSGDGFKNFLNNLANGVGQVIVCAAFPQDCQ